MLEIYDYLLQHSAHVVTANATCHRAHYRQARHHPSVTQARTAHTQKCTHADDSRLSNEVVMINDDQQACEDEWVRWHN